VLFDKILDILSFEIIRFYIQIKSKHNGFNLHWALVRPTEFAIDKFIYYIKEKGNIIYSSIYILYNNC